MEYSNFETLIEQAKNAGKRKRMAIISAAEPHVIDSALKAYHDGIIEPIFIGDRNSITDLLRERKALDAGTIVTAATPDDCAAEAARLVRSGEAECLMKGLMETGPMMKILINKENGIPDSNLISGISIHALATYHKLLGVTDGAMNIAPDTEKKKLILKNAVDAFHALGYDNPKVAALCGVEKVNPKMPETVEAAAVKQWVDEGGLSGCEMEGPISADIAFDQEAGKLKGYQSDVAGNPDILLMPNLVTCNIFNKSIRRFCQCTTVGILLGLKAPMVLLSRSADTNSKYTSIAVVSQMVE